MSIFDRIAIGTANWGDKPYGHRGVICPRSEQEKIITYCQSCGIHTIDTATAYGVDLSWLPPAFEIVMKIRREDPIDRIDRHHRFLAHSAEDRGAFYDLAECRGIPQIEGTSFYDPGEEMNLSWQYYWNVPYSPFDRRWEAALARHYAMQGFNYVRSVFCQGKVFTAEELVFVQFRDFAHRLRLPVGTLCILFCLLNPHVNKVILGVDSVEQLRDDLRFFHGLNSFAVEDPNIIDPRRWEKMP
ncbi:MAG: hypothetical protein PHU85_16955 [Phycisphaerae bacterium]|nr:hypothetical protein [Phycisphaerae bacterium]